MDRRDAVNILRRRGCSSAVRRRATRGCLHGLVDALKSTSTKTPSGEDGKGVTEKAALLTQEDFRCGVRAFGVEVCIGIQAFQAGVVKWV